MSDESSTSQADGGGWVSPGRAPVPGGPPRPDRAPPGTGPAAPSVPGPRRGGRPGGARPGAGSGRTDPVSTAALVTGILPTGPVAVVLGVLGVRRTGRRRRPGRALAVAGLVLGLAWTALLVAAGVWLLSSPGVDGDVTARTDMAAAHLRVGNCVEAVPRAGAVTDVVLVPCSQPHRAQVFHVSTLAAGRGPDAAHGVCVTTFAALGADAGTAVTTLVPQSRRAGGPVVCLAEWPGPATVDLVN